MDFKVESLSIQTAKEIEENNRSPVLIVCALIDSAG